MSSDLSTKLQVSYQVLKLNKAGVGEKGGSRYILVPDDVDEHLNSLLDDKETHFERIFFILKEKDKTIGFGFTLKKFIK